MSTRVIDDALCGPSGGAGLTVNRRHRILLVAYACNPYEGSEAGVGWGWVKAIARDHEVHVLTAEFNREPIERYISETTEDLGSLQFHYVRNRKHYYRPQNQAWYRIEHSVLKPIMNIAYSLWQIDAYHVAERLVTQNKYDLVHLVTYVGFRFAGRFWQLPLPLVWGPIGGLENTPWRLLPMLGTGGAAFYAGRNVINHVQKLLLRNPKQAFRRASGGVIAATSGIREEIRRWYGMDSVVISEIGLPGMVASTIAARESGHPLLVAWSGRHIPGKGLPILLEGLALLDREIDWQLHVSGSGPCTGKWKMLSRQLGIGERCIWKGWLPRTEAVSMMSRMHLQAITSLQELTSSVTIEAISQGVPVLCLDHCGMRDAIDDTCGWMVPVTTYKAMSLDFATVLAEIWHDERNRRQRAYGALRRAEAYSWQSKLDQINSVYARRLAMENPVAVAYELSVGVQDRRLSH